MRQLIIAAAATFAFAGLAACGESAADKHALEAQAAATSNEAEETALNAEADRIEQEAGNVDGGMTTENMPHTSPSTMPPAN